MKKVAKLVTCSLMTRVVVDEDASENEIIEMAKSRFVVKILNELHEHIEDVEDDLEVPYEEGEQIYL